MRIKKLRELNISDYVININMITGISKRMNKGFVGNYHRRVDNIKEILKTIFRADIK